jgi:hypothetical protein
MKLCLVLALVLVLATSAFALERRAYQMKEDFGTEGLYDGALQFYYYIPCPTYSWFWAYSGWTPGDVVGMGFPIGAMGTGGWDMLDAYNCNQLEQIRILDFAGYGTVYPILFDVEFMIWCCIGPDPHEHVLLWASGPVVTHFAWNYFLINPPNGISFCPCPWNPYGYPVVTVTATHVGTDGRYPAWGLDNISTALEQACVMHDLGCLPASYPRAAPGSMPGMPEPGVQVHGGYYGTDPTACPPIGIPDGRDTTPDVTQFGYIELAWRIYCICSGPTATEPSTWGNIKAMYE